MDRPEHSKPEKRHEGREIQWATMPCLTKQGAGEIWTRRRLLCNLTQTTWCLVWEKHKESSAKNGLKRHGLETYVEAFKSNAIDVDMLMELTEDDLQGTEFGMTNALHIKKILKKRHELKPLLQPE